MVWQLPRINPLGKIMGDRYSRNNENKYVNFNDIVNTEEFQDSFGDLLDRAVFDKINYGHIKFIAERFNANPKDVEAYLKGEIKDKYDKGD